MSLRKIAAETYSEFNEIQVTRYCKELSTLLITQTFSKISTLWIKTPKKKLGIPWTPAITCGWKASSADSPPAMSLGDLVKKKIVTFCGSFLSPFGRCKASPLMGQQCRQHPHPHPLEAKVSLTDDSPSVEPSDVVCGVGYKEGWFGGCLSVKSTFFR